MRVLKWFGIAVATLLVLAVVGVFVVTSRAEARLARTWEVEPKDIPVPWPLSADELADLRAKNAPSPPAPVAEGALGSEGDGAKTETDAMKPDPLAGMDLAKIARERAVVRGGELVNNVLGCFECHGSDYGGKVIMENPPMGRWVAPNITAAGLTKDFQPKDWVRILRHGVNHKRQSATMPAIDYTNLSDREISDIVAFIQAQPPVERALPEDSLGPIRAMLIVNGTIPVSAELIDHTSPRPTMPPLAEPSATYGAHIARVCVGCHREDYSGGPIRGGDPSWPSASNLTPDATGMKAWSREDFFRAMREGKRPDGTAIRAPMPWQAMARMSDVQLEAMYAYFMSLPPKPTGT